MKYTAITSLLVAALGLPAMADEAHHKKDAASGTTAAQSAMSDGEVRRVDKDAKKITLRHGPLANLDMPAMTMVFQVRDLAMLDQVKVGDRIKFQAEKVGGAYTVVKIEPAR